MNNYKDETEKMVGKVLEGWGWVGSGLPVKLVRVDNERAVKVGLKLRYKMWREKQRY